MLQVRCRGSQATKSFDTEPEAFRAARAHAAACGHIVDVQAYQASWRLNPPGMPRAARCSWLPELVVDEDPVDQAGG